MNFTITVKEFDYIYINKLFFFWVDVMVMIEYNI